jgi:hypothetical protein
MQDKRFTTGESCQSAAWPTSPLCADAVRAAADATLGGAAVLRGAAAMRPRDFRSCLFLYTVEYVLPNGKIKENTVSAGRIPLALDMCQRMPNRCYNEKHAHHENISQDQSSTG